MGEDRWRSLSVTERAILTEGIAVWEHALESQLHAAEIAGDALGREHGVISTAPSPADVARFLESYDVFAERSAASLQQRFGIDGLTTFHRARALVHNLASSGKIDCNGDGA
jgi:hypothetical protein